MPKHIFYRIGGQFVFFCRKILTTVQCRFFLSAGSVPKKQAAQEGVRKKKSPSAPEQRQGKQVPELSGKAGKSIPSKDVFSRRQSSPTKAQRNRRQGIPSKGTAQQEAGQSVKRHISAGSPTAPVKKAQSRPGKRPHPDSNASDERRLPRRSAPTRRPYQPGPAVQRHP